MFLVFGRCFILEKNPLLIMQTQYESFSKVGQKIATYIMEDPNRAINNSIQQMAKDLSVSEASIVRFSRAIGLSGFSDLRIQLVKHTVASPLPSFFEEIKDDDSMESVAQNVFIRNISTLQTAMQQIDFSTISAAAELIRDAKRIVVCGMGTSAGVAESLYVRLFRVSMPAILETDPEFMQIAARMAEPGTVFVGISRNGRTTAVVKAFEEAQRNGAKTISITTQTQTPLDRASDISIIHYAPTAVMVSTRIVQNTIIDCLYICATRHHQQDVLNQIAENRRVAEFLRMK